jgi:hypothetical protein
MMEARRLLTPTTIQPLIIWSPAAQVPAADDKLRLLHPAEDICFGPPKRWSWLCGDL